MNKFLILVSLVLFYISCKENVAHQTVQQEAYKKPNIVIIYTDDLGYGDVGAYGAEAIKTPNMDFLANNGMKFTDGHSTSATCTPSRYGILTGTYPWRKKETKILPGNAPLVIDTAQATLPKMLSEQGYYTGIVGKWHLGLGSGNVDWNKKITPGPNEVGFDYSYILAATQDRVPTVYIENGRVVNLEESDPIQVSYTENFEGEPTGLDNPELTTLKWHHGHNNSIVNGIPRIGYMKGGEAAKWQDTLMADHFLQKAQRFVTEHSDKPFFLYYAMQQPHVPRTPNPRFMGTTDLGPRGDVIVEADWCIGEFIATLREQGLLENTLIIFSSDNGPVINDGYEDQSIERLGSHTPWGPLRGGKYSLFQAGTRVPFISFWEGQIKSGVSDALISQVDLYSSLAELSGSEKRAEDSKNLLPLLLGKEPEGRESLILEAGKRLALRTENWAMIPPYSGPAVYDNENIESGNSDEYQLYNINDDIGQRKNLADSLPNVFSELKNTFAKLTEVR